MIEAPVSIEDFTASGADTAAAVVVAATAAAAAVAVVVDTSPASS